MPDVLGNPLRSVQSGAYVPFGTPIVAGQVIRGQAKASVSSSFAGAT